MHGPGGSGCFRWNAPGPHRPAAGQQQHRFMPPYMSFNGLPAASTSFDDRSIYDVRFPNRFSHPTSAAIRGPGNHWLQLQQRSIPSYSMAHSTAGFRLPMTRLPPPRHHPIPGQWPRNTFEASYNACPPPHFPRDSDPNVARFRPLMQQQPVSSLPVIQYPGFHYPQAHQIYPEQQQQQQGYNYCSSGPNQQQHQPVAAAQTVTPAADVAAPAAAGVVVAQPDAPQSESGTAADAPETAPVDPQLAALQAAAKAYSQYQLLLQQQQQQKQQIQSQPLPPPPPPPPDDPPAGHQPQNVQQQQHSMYHHRQHPHMQQQPQSFSGAPIRYQQHQYPHPRRPAPAAPIPQPLQPLPTPPAPPVPSEEHVAMLLKLKDQQERFEAMFADWTGQFDMWKKSNARHPQASEITTEWNDWRKKLLDRRNQIQSLIIECVDKIEKPEKQQQPAISSSIKSGAVEQMLTRGSIAHLLQQQPTPAAPASAVAEDDADCEVIREVTAESKKKDAEVITIAGSDEGAPAVAISDAAQPSAPSTDIAPVISHAVAPAAAAASALNKQQVVPCGKQKDSSSSPTRHVLSDDEYGDQPQEQEQPPDRLAQDTLAHEKQTEEDEEEANRLKQVEEGRQIFMQVYTRKMDEIIARGRRNQGYHHNHHQQQHLQPLEGHSLGQTGVGFRSSTATPVKQSATAPRHRSISAAYQINFSKKSSRLDGGGEGDAGAAPPPPLNRNRSPPPLDFVTTRTTRPVAVVVAAASAASMPQPHNHDTGSVEKDGERLMMGQSSRTKNNSIQMRSPGPEGRQAHDDVMRVLPAGGPAASEGETEPEESSNPIPMERRRRKVYSETLQTPLFPVAPSKKTRVSEEEEDISSSRSLFPILVDPNSRLHKFVVSNFEEEFSRHLPGEENPHPDDRIVRQGVIAATPLAREQQQPLPSDRREDSSRLFAAASDAESVDRRRKDQQQQQEQRQQEEMAAASAAERLFAQSKQDDAIQVARRSEVDRIGDQFLEKLRSRNHGFLRQEEHEKRRTTHSFPHDHHPNRYSIERALRQLPRPIVIVLRGLIGSGKSRAAKCIKEEATDLDDEIMCRILSLDDFFMETVEVEVVDDSGQRVTRKKFVYMWDEEREEEYKKLLYQKLDQTLRGRQHEVVVLDACNDRKQDLERIVHSCERNGATALVCEMEEWDVAACFHCGRHDRTLPDIHLMKQKWYDTPGHMKALDWSISNSKATQMKLTTQQDLEQTKGCKI